MVVAGIGLMPAVAIHNDASLVVAMGHSWVSRLSLEGVQSVAFGVVRGDVAVGEDSLAVASEGVAVASFAVRVAADGMTLAEEHAVS